MCGWSNCSNRPSTAGPSGIRSSRSSSEPRGHLDSVPAEGCFAFGRISWSVRQSRRILTDDIKESRSFSEEAQELVAVINDFKKGFATTDGSSVVPGDEHADALNPGPGEVRQGP